MNKINVSNSVIVAIYLLVTLVCVALQHRGYNRLVQELKENHMNFTDACFGC